MNSFLSYVSLALVLSVVVPVASAEGKPWQLDNFEAYYMMESTSTTVEDYTGRHTLMDSGPTMVVEGVIGNALYFDGVSDDLFDSSFMLPTGYAEDYAFSLWINPEQSEEGTCKKNYILSQKGYSAMQDYDDNALVGVQLYTTESCGLSLTVMGNQSNATATASHIAFAEWSHVVGTVASDRLGNAVVTLYVNGKKVSEVELLDFGHYGPRSENFYVGAVSGEFEEVSESRYQGSIDELGIYFKSLDIADVSILRRGGKAYRPVAMD